MCSMRTYLAQIALHEVYLADAPELLLEHVDLGPIQQQHLENIMRGSETGKIKLPHEWYLI